MTVVTAPAAHVELGAFAAGLSADTLPAAVVEKVRCNLLHDLGCAMAAHTVGPAVWPLVRGYAPPHATLVVDGARVPAEQAAFANAVLGHARAQDDTHFAAKCHAGSAVIPAVLAVAQREGAGGAAVIPALVAGYEVATALGEQLAAATTARGFRPSGVFGPIGAAAACASLLGLDAAQAAHAIAIATSLSAGLSQTWIDGSSEYRWQLGAAARNGILAADLARHGAIGADHPLSGAAGLAQAFAGVRRWDPGDLELGERWRILDVIYKPYPVCNITQSAVAVAARIAARHDLAAEDVVAVRCFLNPADRLYPGTLNAGPFTGVGATLMSAQFCVAMALRDRTARFAALAEFDDPALLRLVAHIAVEPDPELPVLAARVEVRTTDGTLLSDELIPEERTYNWDWDGVLAGVRTLAAEMRPGSDADALAAAIRGLPDAPDADAVLDATVVAA
jgi:2-methylcitrate dehydratase PrpD